MAPEIVSFAKIIDNTAADMHESEEQVRWIVGMLRELAGGAQRGPVACVIDPTRTKVTRTFAELSAGDRPIKLFTSLREARRWAAEMVAESNRKR